MDSEVFLGRRLLSSSQHCDLVGRSVIRYHYRFLKSVQFVIDGRRIGNKENKQMRH